MEFGVLGDLNRLAVIVAGLLYYALGALWYAQAVFGRTWQQSMGWQPADDYRPSPTDAALSKAFKRETGMTPGEYRATASRRPAIDVG